MSYFSQWREIMDDAGNSPASEETIKLYYELETAAYETILTRQENPVSGTTSELSDKLGFGHNLVIFTGFLDGINPSLKNELDLEKIEDDTPITLDIDFPKLYWNMHEAKADWLYGLKAWNQILAPEEQQRLTREYRTSKIVRHEKIGRNDPCPCGSGKKYKLCCGKGA